MMGIGTPIDEIRVNEVFEQDINVTIGECKKLFDDWDKLPEEVQLIMANMMFNMGRPRLSQFKKMIQAIRDGDWIEAGKSDAGLTMVQTGNKQSRQTYISHESSRIELKKTEDKKETYRKLKRVFKPREKKVYKVWLEN